MALEEAVSETSVEIEPAMLEIAVTDSIVAALVAGVEELSFVVVATEEAKLEITVDVKPAVLAISETDPSVVATIAGVKELSAVETVAVDVGGRVSVEIELLVAKLVVTGSSVEMETLILDVTTEETSVVMTVEVKEPPKDIVEDSAVVPEVAVVGISELAPLLLVATFTVLACRVDDADVVELDELSGEKTKTALSI